MSLPRVNILGVAISAIDLNQAVQQVQAWIESGTREYINVCTSHTVMECYRNPHLQRLVNGSGMATPDGMPLVWLSRIYGYDRADRVYGPDLMLALCECSVDAGYRHFFYGGAPGVADELAANLSNRFPGLQVAGTYSPPFRAADAPEEAEVLERINAARPHIVWVGLGTPKQDFWIARHRPLLDAPVLVAVGAAFDFHAGRLAQAPRWMQRSGLEWLFRMLQEPRRLTPRYMVNNPLFIGHVLLQLTGLRRYPLEPREPIHP